jgi:putative hydrolase of the HAD superfamily
MILRAVLLDAGGTLIFEHPSRAEIYAEAAERRGIATGADRMVRCMKQAHAALPRTVGGAFRYSEAWFAAFIEHVFVQQLGLPRADLDELCAELFARFADPASFRTYDGAIELCRELQRRGMLVGVLSNWSERLEEILDGVGLRAHMDFVLCSALARLEKPDPEFFALALERTGARAHEVLHAGNDLEKDARAARALGIQAVLVDHGLGLPGGEPAALSGEPIRRVGSLSALLALIDTLQG